MSGVDASARAAAALPTRRRPSWGCSADGLAPGIEPCVLQLRAALQPLTERCAAVHLTVSFYPNESGRRKTPLPKLHHHLQEAAAGCHVALVDSAWSAARRRQRLACGEGEPAVLWRQCATDGPLCEDRRCRCWCRTRSRSLRATPSAPILGEYWPVAALNRSLLPPPDLVAIQHPEFQTLTLERASRGSHRRDQPADTDGILTSSARARPTRRSTWSWSGHGTPRHLLHEVGGHRRRARIRLPMVAVAALAPSPCASRPASATASHGISALHWIA